MRGRSSVWLERLPVTQEAAGSSPAAPANNLYFGRSGLRLLSVCPSHDQNHAVVRACASSSFAVVFTECDDAII
jgi:hypothetical protein